ncbi:MAG: zinc metalloprotease HtpX [Bacteroidota bacterium]
MGVNTLKTTFLMTLMIVLLLVVGQLLGGEQGMMLAFGFSLLMNFSAYWFSDRVVLRMYRAREVSQHEAPHLHDLVRKLAAQVELPMPRVYIIPNATPNAFATGRNPEHAAVAVTEGILDLLNKDELEGVLAHELAHIKHRDTLTGTIAATLVGTITFIARMAGWSLLFFGGRGGRRGSSGMADFLLILVAPIAAVLIHLAISRSREYAADAATAKISGRPLSLASALRKLESGVKRSQMRNVNPSTVHLFIVNPLRGGGMLSLFSTHPPMERRIARLETIAMGQSL